MKIPEPNNVPAMPDNVNHPAHYTAGKIECIDALAEATKGLEGIEAVCTANAIKYLWRWKRKNGVEDLEKARWYINHLIEELTPQGAKITAQITPETKGRLQKFLEDDKPENNSETFRERLQREHLDCVDKRFCGGCCGRPSDYGYEPYNPCLTRDASSKNCRACWDRKIDGGNHNAKTAGHSDGDVAKDQNMEK